MLPPFLLVSIGLEMALGAAGRTDLLEIVGVEHKVLQALI